MAVRGSTHTFLPERRPTYVARRIIVAIFGGVVGFIIGSLAAEATGWGWWIRICVAVAPAIALLIAERKRIVRTGEDLNRPPSLFTHNRH